VQFVIITDFCQVCRHTMKKYCTNHPTHEGFNFLSLVQITHQNVIRTLVRQCQHLVVGLLEFNLALSSFMTDYNLQHQYAFIDTTT